MTEGSGMQNKNKAKKSVRICFSKENENETK